MRRPEGVEVLSHVDCESYPIPIQCWEIALEVGRGDNGDSGVRLGIGESWTGLLRRGTSDNSGGGVNFMVASQLQHRQRMDIAWSSGPLDIVPGLPPQAPMPFIQINHRTTITRQINDTQDRHSVVTQRSLLLSSTMAGAAE